MASAIATERTIHRYGRHKCVLNFADTKFEDEDSYRFIDDCMRRWGGKLYVHCDGRTPLEIFERHKIIPNSAMAPCTYELKIKPFERWLYALPKPLTIVTGLGWHEPHRIDRILHYHKHNGKWRAPRGFARRIHGVYEEFPLLWKPIDYRPHAEVVRSWGIEPPRAYAAGFPHNNCGGRCIKQGISEWLRLRAWMPDRYEQMRDWEDAQREKGGARANAAILRERKGGVSRPLTLVELEKRDSRTAYLPYDDDFGSCFCTET